MRFSGRTHILLNRIVTVQVSDTTEAKPGNWCG